MRHLRTAVGVALAVPSAALGVAGGAVRLVRSGPDGVRRLLDLVDRADALLAAVEAPLRESTASVDGELIDEVVASARALPTLVAAASVAVAQFDRFILHAEGARLAADQLLADVTGLTGRVTATLDSAEGVLQAAGGTVDTARQLAGRAEAAIDGAGLVVTRVDGLAGRAEGVTAGVERVAGTAGQLVAVVEGTAGQAAGLVDRARPLLDVGVELAEQLTEPARAVLPTVRTQAPLVAALAPDLVRVLRELLDGLPELLRRLDQEVLPTLQQLRSTPGDVRALRDTVSDIEPLVGEVEAELAGLPGSMLLRRRGRRAEPDADGGATTRTRSD